MRSILATAALLLAGLTTAAISAGAHEATSKGVTVAHPWVRATPAGAKVGAAFLELKTDANTADKLISASSPVAGVVELHTHIHDNGVMKMRKVDGMDLKPGASHILKPMADHIMLMDLKQPLKEGDLVKLKLNFEKAGAIEVEATVEPAGAMGPHGMPSQPVDGAKKDSKADPHAGHH